MPSPLQAAEVQRHFLARPPKCRQRREHVLLHMQRAAADIQGVPWLIAAALTLARALRLSSWPRVACGKRWCPGPTRMSPWPCGWSDASSVYWLPCAEELLPCTPPCSAPFKVLDGRRQTMSSASSCILRDLKPKPSDRHLADLRALGVAGSRGSRIALHTRGDAVVQLLQELTCLDCSMCRAGLAAVLSKLRRLYTKSKSFMSCKPAGA